MSNNLYPYLKEFDDFEKALLCRVINTHSEGRLESVHLGTLPFVDSDLATDCVRKAIVEESHVKKLNKVLRKLKGFQHNNKSFQIYLDSKRFLKHRVGFADGNTFYAKFGVKVNRAVGLQFQVFGNKWVHPIVSVDEYMSIRHVKGNLWEITCNELYFEKVKSYLLNYYGLHRVPFKMEGNPQKRRKRR